MRRVIAFANIKGGSGKSTCALNAAAALAERGRRVLIIDLDPGASASTWFSLDGGEFLLDVLTGNEPLSAGIFRIDRAGLDIIPSSGRLAEAERVLSRRDRPDTRLRDKMNDTRLAGYEYVILDTPPSASVLTRNALAASGELIIPVECQALALSGLASMLAAVEDIRSSLNPDLRIAGILACKADLRTRLSRDVLDVLHERYSGQVYKTVIRFTVRLAEAPSHGLPINLYEPTSAGAVDFAALAKEIIRQENRHD